jgi:hypothetical protein
MTKHHVKLTVIAFILVPYVNNLYVVSLKNRVSVKKIASVLGGNTVSHLWLERVIVRNGHAMTLKQKWIVIIIQDVLGNTRVAELKAVMT